MPALDMPLKELMRYQGSSPRPDDFDAYWDAALAEMRGVNPEVELRPASFQSPVADCFDLYFTGVGGARIHVAYLRPKKQAEKAPAVIRFHGYSGNVGDWFGMLPYAASGFHVAAMDCRGQGGPSEDVGGVVGNTLHGHIIRGLDDAPEKLLFRSIFLDTAEITRIVMAMPEVDEDRVGVFGGSQGGGLTIACAALEPRVNRLAPQYPFLSDYRRVWSMDLAKNAYVELSQYFRRFDPMHLREEEMFTRLGYVDVQNLAPRIRGRVRMTTGLMDETCPPSTQFAAYNKITAPKELCVYPDYGHEGMPGHDDRTYGFMMEMA